MNGNDIGSLSIIRSSKNNLIPDILWTKSGSQDNIWRMGRANLDKKSKIDNFTVLFIGQKGKGNTGIKTTKKIIYKYLVYKIQKVTLQWMTYIL